MTLHFFLSIVISIKAGIDSLNELLERKIEELFTYGSGKRRNILLMGPEVFEERVVPAGGAPVDLWIGPANGNFSNPANWSINGQQGTPQNGALLQFGGQVGTVTGANTSAVDDMAGLSIASLNISNSYNQTITLNNLLSITSGASITNASPTIAGNGGITFSGNNLTFIWGGGTISTGVTFSAAGKGGTVTINGNDVTLNSSFKNWGTITWTSASPQNGPGPNINLGANGSLINYGTFNIQTASTESITGKAGSKVWNYGIMQKTGANNTTFDPDFTNQTGGTMTFNSGKISYQGLVIDDGSMVLNGGNVDTNQEIDVLSDGQLSGVGTITKRVGGTAVDSHGTVTPGVNGVPGKLIISGGYTQESDGELTINIDGEGNIGYLDVSGAETLNGTLLVFD